MNKAAIVALALFAASSHADEPKSLIGQVADEWVYQTLKDQETP